MARARASAQNLDVDLVVGADLSDVEGYWALDRPGELDDAQLNEFQHHLIARATTAFQATGHSAQSNGAALDHSVTRFRMTVPAGVTCPDLLLLRAGSQVDLFVVGDEHLQPELVERWGGAARSAMDDLGRKREGFEWAAIIGGYAHLSSFSRLIDVVNVRGVQLAPLPEAVTELLPGSVPSLGGGAIGSFWPVLVSGTIEGYSWHGDGQLNAASVSELLCSYLSTVTPMVWRTRQAVMPVAGSEVMRG